MANIKIRELETGSISNNNDYFVVATNSGDTVKIPYSALVTFLFGTSLVEGNNISIVDVTQQDGIKRYSISATTVGSMWYFGNTQPTTGNINDYWLCTDTNHYGYIYQYDGVDWNEVGTFAGRDGIDGTTPHIDSTNRHWCIGETDTGVVAEGQDGTNGTNGITPHIDANTKHWFIGETDTDVLAEGQDGAQGQQGIQGNDGASISFVISEIEGGHSITICSTDTSVADETFNVMDGTEIIQTTSDNRQITLLAADWIGSSAPYTQTVNVTGILETHKPILDLSVSDIIATGISEIEQWSYITKAVTGAGTITFSCYEEKPTIDLTVNVKVV